MEALIKRSNLIDVTKIDKCHYFETLIDEAVRVKLLTFNECLVIQESAMKLLAEIANDYCSGESSSISNDEAVCLMESILYTVSQKLDECDNPEYAVSLLKSSSIQELYALGREIISNKLAYSKELYSEIKKNLFVTPNKFYRSTLVDGISGFFKLYRPNFAAGETHITADYIPAIGRPKSCGIDFIYEYLQRLYVENQILNRFNSDAVHKLMCGLTPEYVNSPNNIFLYVYMACIGLSLVERSVYKLDLSHNDADQLYAMLKGKTRNEILAIIKEKIPRIACELEFSENARIREYMGCCAPIAAAEIFESIRNDTADKVFLVQLYEIIEPERVFIDNEPMADISYRKLVNRLNTLDDSNDRVDLILAKVNSIADFHDIISDAYLTDIELRAIISRLPDPAINALRLRYCNDDFADETGRRVKRVIIKFSGSK